MIEFAYLRASLYIFLFQIQQQHISHKISHQTSSHDILSDHFWMGWRPFGYRQNGCRPNVPVLFWISQISYYRNYGQLFAQLIIPESLLEFRTFRLQALPDKMFFTPLTLFIYRPQQSSIGSAGHSTMLQPYFHMKMLMLVGAIIDEVAGLPIQR